MKRWTHILGLGLAAWLGLGPAAEGADAFKLKLATLVPTGSIYHKSLLSLREEWRKLSKGSVDVVIYADGKLGGEAQVVRLMGLNSVQAAMVTAVGLAEIEPAVDGLQSIPMGFRGYEEIDYVGEKLQPMLEERMARKGYVVLGWSDAGWARFFSTKPVHTPDDLRKLKLFSWAGRQEQVDIYRSSGFNAVPLETADIVTSLETGLIEAVPTPPVFALASQMDRRARYMLELDWAPLVGALIVRKASWEKIPAEYRDPMLQAARSIVRDIKAQGRNESVEAVKAMEARGLKVTRPSPEALEQWRSAAEAAYPKIRGRIVPADIFDETMRLLKDYRAGAR
jgi:TRAP-type C4-dicarboxylate transport system substrate-binding protein